MKKLLGIVVLGLLWCNPTYADGNCNPYIDLLKIYCDGYDHEKEMLKKRNEELEYENQRLEIELEQEQKY